MTSPAQPQECNIGDKGRILEEGKLHVGTITDINGDQITVRYFSRVFVFKQRTSDGTYVAVGQENSANPATLTILPRKAKSTLKDKLEFFLGFLWGWRA